MTEQKGILTRENGKTLFIPKAELNAVGCANCIWKLHEQCPHGLIGNESYPTDLKLFSAKKDVITRKDGTTLTVTVPSEEIIEGICPEMMEFLGSLSDSTGSTSVIWEKFHIYKARLQENDDYASFVEVNKKIKIKEEQMMNHDFTEKDEEMLSAMRTERSIAKMYWIRLNEHVIRSLQKINDREAKPVAAPKLPGIMSSGTINFNITEKDVKQLEVK